ncbi:MAG: 3-isopropylmalate dehydratase small subunit [Deltaproteobacteria bacterium]|nr:3-isopropylmalate dehydratase small subunit [Deltaproteobacteria bacterium]
MKTRFTGKVWKFGRDIDTDVIIPARYLTTIDPKELAAHCLEPADPEFAQKVQPGDVIVGGENFGCGSSREHAPMAIQGADVGCVVAASFARIFYRNAVNLGLPVIVCPEAVDAVEKGDDIDVDLEKGTVTIPKTGATYTATPLPDFMANLLAEGGLVPYTKKRLAANG